ncbi:MAG: hypothetical protein ACR2MP_02010 [Streptosporangiaceae bacterium]
MTDLAAHLLHRQQRDTALTAAYESIDRAVLRGCLLVEYRCNNTGCLLLHVWRSPLGVCYYLPRYTLSPVKAAATAESARAKRTRDGYRKWTGRASVLDDLRGWGATAGLQMQCDHADITHTAEELLAIADAALPGKPTRRTLP